MKTLSLKRFLLFALAALLVYSQAAAQIFSSLHEFDGSDGALLYAGLVLSNNTLFGVAYDGGSYGYGTVFKINTDGTGFTNLYNFTNGIDGAYPYGTLVLSSNTLYGRTWAYNFESGFTATIFSINTDGTGFATLHTFTNTDEVTSDGGLTLSGNNMLYGTAEKGGSSSSGTIFAIATNGIGFTNLYSFTAVDPFNNDGAYPVGSLILFGDTLYGTASAGGTGADGAVFMIHTDGTGFTNLYNIYPYETQGALPLTSLVLSRNTLYGTTYEGNTNDDGAVFALSLGPIPLNVQNIGPDQIITWGNPAFSLQTASALTGPWTTLTSAASPYTINATNAQAFFQLVYTNGP